LNGTSYIVNSTADPGSFYVKSENGTQINVSPAIAATLFGAENALGKLSGIYSVASGQSTSLANQTIQSFNSEYVSASLGLVGKSVSDAFLELAGQDGVSVSGQVATTESLIVEAIGVSEAESKLLSIAGGAAGAVLDLLSMAAQQGFDAALQGIQTAFNNGS